MKKILLVILFISISKFQFAQNVGVNATGATPDVSSILDVLSTNKGMLIPRVALTSTTDAVTIATPATSLFVYNTATAGVSPNNVIPGFYYNSGTSGAPIWTRFANGNGASWLLTGNAGTSAATNFIGTTDAVDWVIRTSNIERMRVLLGGNVGIGTATPAESFSVFKTQAGWQGRFSNSSGTGADVYLSHGAGYGMHIRGWNATDAIYTLEMYNNTSLTNAFYNSGRVALGLVGNVGAGLANPAYKLEINGSFGYGNGTSGVYRSRTETRDDAGQIATQSGFFETSAPTNYYAGAGSWQHLIDVRHSNNGNNYALQISGSFFDQNLYFRKTNNNPAQAWSQFLTSSGGVSNAWLTLGNNGTNAATNFIGTIDGVDWVMRTSNVERARITAGGNVGMGATAPAVKLAINGNGVNVYATDQWLENNMHVQGNEGLIVGGRGRLRVGTAWNYVGMYADASSGGLGNDLVLGASSGTTRVGCNGCTTQNLLVNGTLTVYPTSNTFNRIISGGAGSYLGIYTDALYTGTATAPTFLWDGMTLSSVGTTFGDVSYSSENSGGWHYWMIGGGRRMRLDQFNWLMLNAGTFSTTGADVAEEFSHDGSLEEGDVVMIDAEGENEIKKCDKPKSSKVFGVISTTPGMVLNSINTDDFDKQMAENKPNSSQERGEKWAVYRNEHKKKHLPVALNGRTPCKVVSTSGQIKKGDFITSSSKAGYGEKLVGSGSYFGIALEDDKGIGKIMIAIKNGYTNE